MNNTNITIIISKVYFKNSLDILLNFRDRNYLIEIKSNSGHLWVRNESPVY